MIQSNFVADFLQTCLLNLGMARFKKKQACFIIFDDIKLFFIYSHKSNISNTTHIFAQKAVKTLYFSAPKEL